MNVAALFVDPRGPYPELLGAEFCWDAARDARSYPGPWPVVAHPPCARWCRLAKLVESQTGLKVGDDGGTFAVALHFVRTYGGVLEHPAWSLAWGAHGLAAPPARGWHRDWTDRSGGWCCEVSQAAYGHRARKLTWLYYVGETPPALPNWQRPRGTKVVTSCRRRGDGSYWSTDNGRSLTKREASRTPTSFAEWLISLARRAGQERTVDPDDDRQKAEAAGQKKALG